MSPLTARTAAATVVCPGLRTTAPGTTPVARFLVALAVALLAVTGCTVPAERAAEDGEASGTPPSLDAVVAEGTWERDPRSWTGPSTAVAADDLRPVSTSPRPELPVSVVDHQGTRSRVESVDRVLALDIYGTLARTVFELGLGDRLVGRDISTQFAEAADLPLVTQGGHDLSAEAILALDPTLVITDTTLGPWDVLLQVRDAGIPVVVLDPHRGLDNVAELTRDVARALGVPALGERLAARTEAEIAQVGARIAEVAPTELGDRLRTVMLYVRGRSGIYSMFGEGTGADALIDALGAYDVAEEIGWSGTRPITDEGLIAAQPDVVLVMSGGLESTGGVDGLLERLSALAQTPAGEHQRVVDMADSQLLGFGTLTPRVLDALAVALYAPGAEA